MKILHTADWHLGKKIEGKSMLDSQRAVLQEIQTICENENPDAVIIAGDVFDTAVPPAEAEELFYESAKALAKGRVVVALAGNHDDPDRLCAARGLAKKHNIFLIGGLDNGYYDDLTIGAGKGFIKIKTNSGLLNIALLPYPTESILPLTEGGYTERVKAAADECCSCFTADGVNIFVTHLFSSGRETEEMLGGARLLPKTIFPQNAHYCAVGHVHKPMTISASRHAYYSGSIIPCNFEETEQKSVNSVTIGETTEVRAIPLNNYKKLIKIEARDYDEAFEKLSACDQYAEILYDSIVPLNTSQMGKLRACPAFLKFTPCAVREERSRAERKFMSDEALFRLFYEQKRGKSPDETSVELFMKAVRGEEIL